MDASYPLPSFYFKVVFSGHPGSDTSFQEVSGISAQLDTEEYAEGGENSFVYALPTRIKHDNLLLKRAIAPSDSSLVTWCNATIDRDAATRIETRDLSVWLLDETGEAVRSWTFRSAYPVKWSVDGFNSGKNDVAIETIELAYTQAVRES